MDKIIIVIAAAALTAVVVWWFFGKRSVEVVKAERRGDRQVVEIVVNGGYIPKVVELAKDIPADIVFVRKDPSACFEEVVLPDFGASANLPVDKPYTISVTPNAAGEYSYSCGMHMFFGKVIVK